MSGFAPVRQPGIFTPGFTFATPGTIAATITTARGVYRLEGDTVHFWLLLLFNTNGYTGASGAARFTGLPFASLADATLGLYPLNAPLFSNVVWNGLDLHVTAMNPCGTDYIEFYASRTAAGSSALSTAAFPASTNNLAARVSGSYVRG